MYYFQNGHIHTSSQDSLTRNKIVCVCRKLLLKHKKADLILLGVALKGDIQQNFMTRLISPQLKYRTIQSTSHFFFFFFFLFRRVSGFRPEAGSTTSSLQMSGFFSRRIQRRRNTATFVLSHRRDKFATTPSEWARAESQNQNCKQVCYHISIHVPIFQYRI